MPAEPPPPAQITLTDCLACSGCVTSAEAVLVSLQSHSEVLNALDSYPSLPLDSLRTPEDPLYDPTIGKNLASEDGKIFVVSVSPQVRASLAATYKTTEQEAGWMIEQLLSGPEGIKKNGNHGSSFAWVIDTNAMREASLVIGAEEVLFSQPHSSDSVPLTTSVPISARPKYPVLTSACPGWICYAEKTHPHILPHLSRLKSPQALTGTLLKTVLSTTLSIPPDKVFHLAIMPCFDKKLEASREELTDFHWGPESSRSPLSGPIRDVDCVITARELLMLAESRGISFPSLPRRPLSSPRIPFPSPQLDAFLFPSHPHRRKAQSAAAGSSGGYLYSILLSQQSLHPGSRIISSRGRNADIIEYTLLDANTEKVLFRAARYYGFRNITNLVRKLNPVKKARLLGGKAGGARRPGVGEQGTEYAYVEVMACPGGCTNGGGQIKIEDLGALQSVAINGDGQSQKIDQKEWLARVDEAYYSMSSDDDNCSPPALTNNLSDPSDSSLTLLDSSEKIHTLLSHWSHLTHRPLETLLFTSYRAVVSDVGKGKGKGDGKLVEQLAGKIEGGW